VTRVTVTVTVRVKVTVRVTVRVKVTVRVSTIVTISAIGTISAIDVIDAICANGSPLSPMANASNGAMGANCNARLKKLYKILYIIAIENIL